MQISDIISLQITTSVTSFSPVVSLTLSHNKIQEEVFFVHFEIVIYAF